MIVLLVLGAAIIISLLLYYLKPVAEKQSLRQLPPLAEFVTARSESLAVPVFSQGSIKAETRIKLVAEVSGRISQMAQLKSNGGFFKKGDLLLAIDDTDYSLALSRARAQLAAARQQLIRVETEAAQARYDLQQIGGKTDRLSAYALRKPQLAEAEANLQAAQADLKIAQLKMRRTRVLAPFNGRVVNRQVDIGQYVSTGTLLAEIYATDRVEVRLPLSLLQIELLGIALRDDQPRLQKIDVQLYAQYAQQQFQWQAELSHIEAELDARNRMVYVVADVEKPYVYSEQYPQRPPLTPGMFVKARLTGLARDHVIKLPRRALRQASELWLIDGQDRLQKKQVQLYGKDRDFIYVKSGIQAGDRVIVNAVDFPVPGMSLRLAPFSPEESLTNE